MSTRLKNRSFLAQFLVALGRTSPAYATGPGSGCSRGRQFLAALGRQPVAAQRADDPEAASFSLRPPFRDLESSASDQGSGSTVADLLLSLPPATRLSLRSHPEMLSLALAFQTRLALNLTRDLDRDLALDLDRARDLAHDLTLDLDRARDLAHDLDRDLTRALNRARAYDLAHDLDRTRDGVRDLALDLDRDLTRAHDLAHALTRDRARDLAHALTLDLDRDHARARGLAYDLTRNRAALAHDLDYDLDHARELDLNRAGGFGLARVRYLSGALDRALSDFTGADLRDADLTGLSLAGIRWSRTTRWPSAWAEEIERSSVEIQPGIFEIRGGTASVDASTVMVGV